MLKSTLPTKWTFLRSRSIKVISAALLLLYFGYLDLISGEQIAFSCFYLLPISIVSWYVNREAGIAFSCLAALLCLLANYGGSAPAQVILIQTWNAIAYLIFFILTAILLAKLKMAMEIESRLARIDFLTGIPNHHDFADILFLEMERARRYERPLTLAYIDCDDFTKVNDTLGREQGDLLLKEVANCLLEHTRKTDKIARMGGDEFAMMLPETSETQAREILLRLHVKLLTVMELYKWPVTFSIGSIGFEDIPLTTQDAIRETEKMMLLAKQNGRNQLATKTIRSVVEQANKKRWS